MFALIGLLIYSYFAIPWMMDTIGTSIIASVIATVVTYFVGVGMLFGMRPSNEPRQTIHHDYDRPNDRL